MSIEKYKKYLILLISIIFIVILSIILAKFSSNKATNQNSKNNLKIELWENSHGTQVYYNYNPELPLADIVVMFNAGSVFAAPGVALTTVSMLNEGSKNKSAQDIAYGFESNGAKFSASADKEKAVISLRSVTKSRYFKPSINLFKEVISSPSFPQDNLNLIKSQLIQSLQFKEQSPASILGKELSKNLYKNSPYAELPIGNIDAIKKITSDNLKNYYHKYFTQKNAKIIINGDINKKYAEQIAQELLNNLPLGDKKYELPDYNFTQEKQNIAINFPSTQTHIAIASPGVTIKDNRYFSLILGNTILGDMPLTSKLFKEIRTEMGLAYSIGSSFSAHEKFGSFLIKMQTRNSEAKKALTESTKILKNFIKNGPSDEELISAKKYLLGSFPLSFASSNQKTALISAIAFYDLPLNYLEKYPEKINAVTKEQIILSFRQIINPEKIITVQVGKQ